MKFTVGASLVTQWERICLPMQETQGSIPGSGMEKEMAPVNPGKLWALEMDKVAVPPARATLGSKPATLEREQPSSHELPAHGVGSKTPARSRSLLRDRGRKQGWKVRERWQG